MLGALLTTLTVILVALALCVLLEYASPKTRYSMRSRFPGMFFIVIVPICGVLASFPLGAAWRSVGIGPLFDLSGLPSAIALIALLFVHDFFKYWMHRFDHRVMWRFHSIHHAETELHAANGYAHPMQVLSEFLLLSIPLSLIKTDVTLPMELMILISIQSIIIHSPLRVHLGPLRYFWVDSRFHRIHHSIEERHFEKNFGTMFSIWDQLFGTAYFPGADEWPDTGLAGVGPARRFDEWLLRPFREANRGPPHSDRG